MNKELNLNIAGMSCVNCAKNIENFLKKDSSIRSCTVNFSSSKANIVFNDLKLSEEQIVEKISHLGYKATFDLASLERQKYLEFIQLKKEFFLSAFIAVLLFAMMFINFTNKIYIMLILASIVQFYAGKRFYISSYKALKNRNFDMNVLVALGTSSAYFYSAFVVLFPFLFPQELKFVYFDGAVIIITFVLLGRFLEEKSKNKATKFLKEFEELLPKTAIIEKDTLTQTMPLEKIEIGDITLIKAGEKIPVDGVVVEGSADIDTSNITGEFMLVNKTIGESVIAGTINKSGFIKVKVEKRSSDSLISKIVSLLNLSQNQDIPIARVANKVASIFVPIVILISALTFLVWFFVFDNPLYAILTSISVLIISCPCALGLATPITIVNAIGRGAKDGILIKNPAILEIIHEIKYAIFDKTGTLTKGEIKVEEYLSKDNKDLVAIVSIQKHSEHPISYAVTSYFKDLEDLDVIDFQTITGKGVQASVRNSFYQIGTKKFLEENSVQIENSYKEFANKALDEGKAVIFASKDQKCIAVFTLSDTIKDETNETIKKLKDLDITPIMITGDNEKVAKNICKQVGIEKYYAQVLPHKKFEIIEKLQKEEKVLFVGDGVNDSLALKKANIGIAMSSGADIAKEAGDIMILDSNLSKVISSIDLSKNSIKIIKQNLFWAFFYNSLGIPLAAGILYPFFGILLSPMYAGIAMSFSSLIVVLNSLRIRNMTFWF